MPSIVAKKQHLHRLFDAHTKDLNELLPQPEDIVACPICLNLFDRNDIDKGEINTGHVWPKSFRKESEKTAHMQVILCRSCNQKSGPADNQLQLYDKITRGEKTGKLHSPRTITLIEEGSDKPLKLRANVKLDSGILNITGRTRKDGTIRDLNPAHQSQFDRNFRDGRKADITIEPLKGYKPGIVPLALITSSYLMAYYALGYRYIVKDNVEVVREFILKAFENKSDEVEVPKDENFTVEKYVNEYFTEPRISFVFPYGNTAKVYVMVSILDACVRLPVLYNQPIFMAMVHWIYRSAPKEFQMLTTAHLPLIFKLPCTKTVIHECIFDYLLNKPGTPPDYNQLTLVLPPE